MNADTFPEVLYNVFNRSLEVGEFPLGMKLANLTPVRKKVADIMKLIINLLAFCLTYQKSLKDVYTSKLLTLLILYWQNINVVSGKDIVHITM